MKKNLISVVIPVYNEEENLPIFYERLTEAIKDKNYTTEIIFVNDGSYDNSWKIIQELAKKDNRVKGYNLSRNSGSYAAIECGFNHAQGNAVMSICADLQDPPEIINKFVPEWEKGNHIIWGTRDGRDDPFFKTIFANLFYSIIRKIAFPSFPKGGMDIGLFDRNIIEKYLTFKDRNSIPFFTIFSMGFKQVCIPYRREKRLHGESGWPFWKRIKCAIDIAIGFSYIPIRIITTVGILCAFIAFLYGGTIIASKLFGIANFASEGWSSLAVLILFVGGIQMVFMGIIAEYLWRTNDRVKNFPVYMVMDETKK